MHKKSAKIDDPDAKAFLPLYASKVSSPEAWIAVARELMAAASALEGPVEAGWEAMRARFGRGEKLKIPPNMHGVYFVLVGYAVENLAKAIIVARDTTGTRQQTVAAEKIPARLKTHNLFGLLRDIDFPFEQGDEDLLRRLTRHTEWAGRYPVPVSFEAASHSEVFSNGKACHVAYTSGMYVQLVKRLIVRLARNLYDEFRSTNLSRWIDELEASEGGQRAVSRAVGRPDGGMAVKPHDDVMTIDELAEYLKLSKSTLYKLAQLGKVPGQKVGKHWRFHKDMIDAWLRQGNASTNTRAD